MPYKEQYPDAHEHHDFLRFLAEAAARSAGDWTRGLFRTELQVELKADGSEVTHADFMAQESAVGYILCRWPTTAFIAEERGGIVSGTSALPSNDKICWVIDGLDGTRNYVRGIPLYASSVAAMFGGVPLAGAIYDPERDTLYSASQKEGFFVNEKLQPPRQPKPPVSGAHNLRPIVGLPSTLTGPVASLARSWLGRFVCRNFGSTALHLAMVATGELDAMLADNARLWDIAAGCALVTASGGKVTSPDGSPLFPLDVQTYTDQELPTLAASAAMHERLVRPQ